MREGFFKDKVNSRAKTQRKHKEMSKVEIYYFSGTGNSLHVAKELQKRIPETNPIPILSLLNKDVIETDAETVGFVFPIYCHTVPMIVKNVIKKLELKSTNYLFAVATTATTQCRAFPEIDQVLRKKSKRLNSYFTLKMPHNMPFYIEHDHLTAKEQIAKMKSDLQNKLETIGKIIINAEKHRVNDPQFTDPIPGFLLPFMSLLIPINRFIVKEITVFYSDSKCTGCGICEKVCLSNKINIVNKRPVWQKDVICYQCQACINYCPDQSIQQKSTWFMKSYSDQNGRYHNPEVTVNDLAGQKSFNP